MKKICDAAQASYNERQLAEDTFSFCMEHKQEHFTIAFLAERAGVSPTKLKQVYRRVYGTSLFAHIRREKMLFAAHELAVTNTKIVDIAGACGYDNASKFSAAFRHVMGCSPQEYRKKSVRSRKRQKVCYNKTNGVKAPE